MPTTKITVERDMPCDCSAISSDPFPCCPACEGSGVAWTEVDVEIVYGFHRPSRGARDSLGGIRGAGPQLEPDDPGGCEIESTSIDLSDAEMEKAEEACSLDQEERYEAAMEARYENARDNK